MEFNVEVIEDTVVKESVNVDPNGRVKIVNVLPKLKLALRPMTIKTTYFAQHTEIVSVANANAINFIWESFVKVLQSQKNKTVCACFMKSALSVW